MVGSGNQCSHNYPPALNASSGVGNGHAQVIGGLNSYVSSFSSSLFAIILISDVFGTFSFLFLWDMTCCFTF